MPRTYSHTHDPHHVFEADTIKGFTPEEIDTAVGYANKLSNITEEWDGRNAIIANGGNIEPQQLFAFDIDITQLPDITTEVTPNELTQAIYAGKKIYYSIYGYEIEDSGFTFVEDDNIFTPAPLIIHNGSMYSGGVLVLSFFYSPDSLDSPFIIELNTIDFNNNDPILHEHIIQVSSATGITHYPQAKIQIVTNSPYQMDIDAFISYLDERGCVTRISALPTNSFLVNSGTMYYHATEFYANTTTNKLYLCVAGISENLDANNKLIFSSNDLEVTSILDTVTPII